MTNRKKLNGLQPKKHPHMKHNDYISLFEGMARQHYQLQHEVDGKNSFFRINSEAEMQQALAVDAHFPAMLLLPYFGKLAANGDDLMTGVFEIRDHADVLDFASIEDVRERCKQIGLEIIARIFRTMEEEGRCGPIASFDLASVRYDFTGPVNQHEYGCLFVFTFQDEGVNPYSIDLDGIFINEDEEE